MNNPKNKAILRSAAAPNEKNRERLLAFLKKTYQQDVELEWQEDEHIQDGFLLQIGTDIYDWTIEGRLRQFKERLEKLPNSRDDIIPLMKESVENWTPEVTPEEIGEVIAVGDNIATISGLEHAAYGEILLFPSGIKGMVQDLKPGEIGCILFWRRRGGQRGKHCPPQRQDGGHPGRRPGRRRLFGPRGGRAGQPD